MSTKRIPAGTFNHDPVSARKLAQRHDVIVEVRGEPSAVLVSYERYERMLGSSGTPMDLLFDEAAAEVDFEPARLTDLPDPADL